MAASRTTRRWAMLLALLLAFAPALGFARAGGGASMGSRGERTYFAPRSTPTAPYAAPIGRSTTPQYGGYGTGYVGGYAPQRRYGFGTGLAAGLIGGGLLGLMGGHGFGYGGAGVLGGLLQLVVIALIVGWLLRRFRGGGRLFGGLGGGPRFAPSVGAAYAGPAPAPGLALQHGDYQAFEQVLQGVQAAWTAQDIPALQSMATPEMVGYFAQQLADQRSRGVRNSVTDVRLQRGDLSEAWQERGADYATVAMRFSMIDVTRDAAGRVVDGSPTEHSEASEFWTFLRAPGGRWLLSAIQQGR